MREQTVLCVAAPQVAPLSGLHSVADRSTGSAKWWSQHHLGQVTDRADQVAIMAYDTAMPLKSLYGGYVAQQTALALEVAPKRVDLLIGRPAFHAGGIGHHSRAETVTTGVPGARLALGREDLNREQFGVACYVDFAATAAGWPAHRHGWGRT